MPRRSPSSESPAPAWLAEQVYTPKRQRTIDLVHQSVEALRSEKARISLASIAAKSRELDPSGAGVSESAILTNGEARACYEQYRTWKQQRRSSTSAPKLEQPTRVRESIKLGRDEERARQRYLRFSKPDLVDRLLAAERFSAEQEQRWLSHQDDLLMWRMRAQAAETRIAQVPDMPTVAKSSTRTKSRERTTGPLPKQFVSLLAFARHHNIAESTVQTHMDMGLLPVKRGAWTETDGMQITLALDSKGQAAFYQLYCHFPHFLKCPHCSHGYQESMTGRG